MSCPAAELLSIKTVVNCCLFLLNHHIQAVKRFPLFLGLLDLLLDFLVIAFRVAQGHQILVKGTDFILERFLLRFLQLGDKLF